MGRPAAPFYSRLPVRFAAMLALALVPIGLLAVIQTNALKREVIASEEAAMMGATLRAADEVTAVILRARGLAAGLAQAVVPLIGDIDACSTLMQQIVRAEPLASLVGFFPVGGVMRCSSSGKVVDFSDSALFAEVISSEAPHFVVNRKAPISGTSVLGVSHPVYDASGRYLGYVSISLPHTALDALREDRGIFGQYDENLLSLWTFDRDGLMLTASADLTEAQGEVPVSRPLVDLVNTTGDVFEDRSANGQPSTYVVVPIVAGDLYLMSRWDSAATRQSGMAGLWAYLPTLMMWLAGLVVAIAASERLVTRHVRVLNRAIRSFAKGDRSLSAINLGNAPAELRQLGEAYLSMTEAITHGEARMEDTVHKKRVLLREVHHRVKNNLQLIASIMNIQMRKATSPEAKTLLKGLQDRVMSLATIHRGLYQTSGMTDVHAKELFTDIVRQITTMSSGGDRNFRVVTDIDDIRLVPDQAVPLSLLMTEALTNAIKHSQGTRANPGVIELRLKHDEDLNAVLEVGNSAPTMDVTDATRLDMMNTGLGTQLLTAFAQQLGGQLEQGEMEGQYVVRLRFTMTPLVDAEHNPADTVPEPPQEPQNGSDA